MLLSATYRVILNFISLGLSPFTATLDRLSGCLPSSFDLLMGDQREIQRLSKQCTEARPVYANKFSTKTISFSIKTQRLYCVFTSFRIVIIKRIEVQTSKKF